MRTVRTAIVTGLAAATLATGVARSSADPAERSVRSVAGNLNYALPLGDNGPATLAHLENPWDVCFDAAGNLYVSDLSLNRVRRIAPDGTITTIAGDGSAGTGSTASPHFGGDGGPAKDAQLNGPLGIAADPAGNVYFADWANNRVRRIDTAGVITTFAGDGEAPGPFTFTGSGVTATSTALTTPKSIACDTSGNVFIANDSFLVRVTNGILTKLLVQGTGIHGGPHAVATWNGQVYFCDDSAVWRTSSSGGASVRVAGQPNGVKTTYAGEGGLATNATLGFPEDVAFDGAGNLYIADHFNSISAIRRVDAVTGVITTYAGTGQTATDSRDSGAATTFLVNAPTGITATADGAVYFTDRGSGRILDIPATPKADAGPDRAVEPSGPSDAAVTLDGSRSYDADGLGLTYSWSWPGGSASGVAPTVSLPLGDTTLTLTVVGSGGRASTDTAAVHVARRMQGVIARFAGNLNYQLPLGDGGPALQAHLENPWDVEADPAGNVYTCDIQQCRVREVRPDGVIVTVAGNGTGGFSGDNGPATSAQLSTPMGAALDGAGNLYVADWGNNRVRKVDAQGTITTFAGNGAGAGSFVSPQNNVVATSTGVSKPTDVVVAADGAVFIADEWGIRKVTPDGRIWNFVLGASAGSARGLALDGHGFVCWCTGGARVAKAPTAPNNVNESGVTTVAGTGSVGFSGDAGPALWARLASPQDIAFDGAGNLFIADSFNPQDASQAVMRVRKVDANGIISTYAGSGVFATDPRDLAPASSYSLNLPTGIAATAGGMVYVSDRGSRRILSIVANRPPVANAGPDQTVEATSLTATAVSLDGSASSDPDADPLTYAWSWSAGGASLTASGVAPSITLPYGDTMVTLIVDDGHGGSATDTVVVHVVDTTAPIVRIDAPADGLVVGPAGNPVALLGRVDDVNPAAVTSTPAGVATNVPAGGGVVSGAVLLPDEGGNAVTVSATDAAGNTGTATVHVTRDTTPPVLTLPTTLSIGSAGGPSFPVTATLGAMGADGAAVFFTVTAHDLVSGDVPVTCTPASGATFAPGTTTTVECGAVDGVGNRSTASFTVTIGRLPTANAGPDQTLEATGPTTLVALDGSASTADLAASGNAIVGYRWTSSAGGASFTGVRPTAIAVPVGDTTFQLEVTDSFGATATDSVVVHVVDTTPPVLTLPADITADSAHGELVNVTYSASATDRVSGSVQVTCTPPSGSAFVPGVTLVTCTATDAAGNRATGAFSVTVRRLDGRLTLSVTGVPSELWPPNHQMVRFYPTVNVSSPTALVVCLAESNEPDDGQVEGDKPGDIVVHHPGDIELRAERRATGNGRAYTIYWIATELNGDVATVVKTVTVPKSRGIDK